MKQMIFLLSLIVLAAGARLLPHAPNFTPLGALALFSGYFFPNRNYGLLPLMALAISDLLLGGFYGPVMFYVYAGFALTFLLGRLVVQQRVRLGRVLGTSLVSSILFYLITNFAVWFHGSLYPHNLAGLMESYVVALPFFRNSLLGDFFYNTVFFAAYSLAYQKSSRPTPAQVRSS